MREIKFRAWDKETKAMRDILYWYLEENNRLVRLVDYAYSQAENELSIMQFTGLKDKNGKEIYEGDIVKIPNSVIPAVCEWSEHMASFNLVGETVYAVGYTYHDECKQEIIGNIYENPGLIEVKP